MELRYKAGDVVIVREEFRVQNRQVTVQDPMILGKGNRLQIRTTTGEAVNYDDIHGVVG